MKAAFLPTQPQDPSARGAIFVWRCDDVGAGLSAGPALRAEDAINFPTAGSSSQAQFYWGYRPVEAFHTNTPNNPQLNFTDRFDVRVGIYRDFTEYSTFWIDGIKLTNNEACLPGTTSACAP